MPVKSSENTSTLLRFRAALGVWLKKSGKNKTQVAAFLGIPQGHFVNLLNGKRSISVASMEEIAEKIGIDLTDMLIEGRAILAGEGMEAPADTLPDDDQPVTRADLEALKAAIMDEIKTEMAERRAGRAGEKTSEDLLTGMGSPSSGIASSAKPTRDVASGAQNIYTKSEMKTMNR